MRPIAFVLLLTALHFSISSAETKPKQTTTQEKYTCVAGPDEQCASDLWYAELLRSRQLQKDASEAMLKAGIQQKYDEASGIVQRLAQQVPAGFTWDDAKKRFVKVKSAVVAPAPAPEKK